LRAGKLLRDSVRKMILQTWRRRGRMREMAQYPVVRLRDGMVRGRV
jgi:hypothetical protein